MAEAVSKIDFLKVAGIYPGLFFQPLEKPAISFLLIPSNGPDNYKIAYFSFWVRSPIIPKPLPATGASGPSRPDHPDCGLRLFLRYGFLGGLKKKIKPYFPGGFF